MSLNTDSTSDCDNEHAVAEAVKAYLATKRHSPAMYRAWNKIVAMTGSRSAVTGACHAVVDGARVERDEIKAHWTSVLPPVTLLLEQHNAHAADKSLDDNVMPTGSIAAAEPHPKGCSGDPRSCPESHKTYHLAASCPCGPK